MVIMYLCLLFIYIFSIFNLTFSPLYFIAILVCVQLVHDMLLYVFIIKPTPYNVNSIVDVYKDYAVELNGKILIADSLMMIGSAIIAMNLKSMDMHVTTTSLIASIYIIPYLLYFKQY